MSEYGPMPEEGPGSSLTHVRQPLRIGGMVLRNRIMVPPHATRVGDLFGSAEEARRNVDYWASRATGVAWINGPSPHIGNRVPVGFEPTGMGSYTAGFFRKQNFVERIQQYAAAVQGAGACATVQMVMQGGMPHAPSASMSAPVYNVVPHVLDRGDIRHIISEYRFAAQQVAKTSVDGVELHLNQDDITEWFISPLTNQRTDEYGGSFENRLRLTAQILSEVREALGPAAAIGVRMNLYQTVPGGFDRDYGIAIAQAIEDSGLVDYLSVVVGTSWGNPSYIQPQYLEPATFAEAAGDLKRMVGLPIVYAGRVTSVDVAERVLAAGHADVIGMARAHIADGELLLKAIGGRRDEVRPCIGCNECISRPYVESLGFACAVNPDVNHPELDEIPYPTSERSVLVVGGGPAGMECAATAAERGHAVELWEAADQLGGQLLLATNAPGYEDYVRYLQWQERRLKRVGVAVRLGVRADAATIIARGADEIVMATGATARVPSIPGVDLPFVHDARDILSGRRIDGRTVAIIAQEDHLAPLATADLLADRGHAVTVYYASYKPASLVGHYMLGVILGRLDRKGVRIECTADAVAIQPNALVIRHTYSDRRERIDGLAAVVLACGGVADDAIYQELRRVEVNVQVLGDAYAPRRLVYATRQGRAVGFSL